MSSRLHQFLEQSENTVDDDLPVNQVEDEFDKLIQRENLQIVRFVWIRELDLALFVLNNRRVISQTLSGYRSLFLASEDHLAAYELSASGIHWPKVDVDLSLRGLLMNEVLRSVALV